MTLRKRLRILYAALTQSWVSVTCPCGQQLWVSDTAGNLLDGQMCDACESKAFEIWSKEYEGRMGRRKEIA